MLSPARYQYTEEQLYEHAHELAGFNEPGDVGQILDDIAVEETRWQPVLSATIVTWFDNDLHILTAKRLAEGHRTHINVASTPTIRLAHQEAGLLLPESLLPQNTAFCFNGQIDPLNPFVTDSLSPSVAALPDNTDILSSKIGYLLAIKLGLGSELGRAREPIGRTSLARCIVGFSYLDNGGPSGEALYEPLVMLGAIVGIDSEVALQIPERTTSYSHIGWTPVDRYVKGVAAKSLLEVIPTAQPEDELEVCVRGLCNATSSTIVRSVDEIQYYLTEEGVMSPF